ncbi:MAG: hypothetical protein NVSMB1_18630 [Polyangiales bacterium]
MKLVKRTISGFSPPMPMMLAGVLCTCSGVIIGCAGPGDSAKGGNVDAGSVLDALAKQDAPDGAARDGSNEATEDGAAEHNDAIADALGGDATDGSTAPYRHTIVIDGANDFSISAEKFTTTSSSYDAFVTWDGNALYIGYNGPDLDPTASPTKWLQVYLDVDPGASTGALTGETYNTEHPKFPSGFGAEYYLAWKTDGSYAQFKKYGGTSWTVIATSGVTVKKGGSYVEMSIPLASLGAPKPAALGVSTLLLNEEPLKEAVYGGLYAGSFVDGYHAEVAVTAYLRADFEKSAKPNAPENKKP